MKYTEGMLVKALQDITESGWGGPDPAARFPEPNYIHARTQDTGVVEYVDSIDSATVRFDRTGTSTTVWHHEIAPIDAGAHAAAPCLDKGETIELIRKGLENKLGDRDKSKHAAAWSKIVDRFFGRAGIGGELKDICLGIDRGRCEGVTFQFREVAAEALYTTHEYAGSTDTTALFRTDPKKEKQMILLTYIPSPDGHEPSYLLTLGWDGERLDEVQACIDEATRQFQHSPHLTQMMYAFEWKYEVISLEAAWGSPLLWPRSFDAEQNKERGSDTLNLRDTVDAESFDVAIVDGESWREHAIAKDISTDLYCYLCIDRDEGGHLLSFEQGIVTESGEVDVRVASAGITPRIWTQLVDATMTLVHLRATELEAAVTDG